MMEAKHLEATTMLTTGPISATPEKTEAFLGQKLQDGGGEVAADESAEPSGEAYAEP